MVDVVNVPGLPRGAGMGKSRTPMPSLFRFLSVIAIIGGLIYGAVYALANFVNPAPREMTINISPDKFQKK
ncbi:Histidine kinase OS=Afipia felis OX=1035 GN=NCTC12722_00617 PE=4 SV=1 [Afipia felis]|jgi:hypothetical protein